MSKSAARQREMLLKKISLLTLNEHDVPSSVHSKRIVTFLLSRKYLTLNVFYSFRLVLESLHSVRYASSVRLHSTIKNEQRHSDSYTEPSSAELCSKPCNILSVFHASLQEFTVGSVDNTFSRPLLALLRACH